MDYKIKQGENYLYLNSQNGARALVSAEQSVKLCGEDTITMKVHSAQPITFNLGDTFDCFGTTYTLNQVPSCVINAPNNLDYTLVFEGLQYRLIDKIFLMPANTKGDNIMLTLSGFMAVLLDNANRGNNGKQYVLGNCPTTEAKNLNFTDKNCLSALQMLVTEYETEYKFVETAQNIRIDIGAVGTTFAYPIKYGVGGGAYELQRTKGTDIVTRLFVYGGTQNLTYYRHDRLCLPSKARTESYIEDSDKIATYGIKEAVKNFDDVYPNRIGAVSSITGCAYNEFIDSSMNFDLNAKWGENDVEEWLALRGLEDTSANRAIYNSDVKNKATKYLMPNETAKIHFNSGALAGYECDINKYDATTKKFTLVPLVDENGYDFPSKTHSAFKIGVNDTYVILGINLPTEYKEDAEDLLQEKAEEYYEQVSNPQYKYSLAIAPLILKRMENNVERDTFKVGDYIHVIDEANNVNADIRIDSFTRDLINPFDYKLQLSDDLVVNQQVRQLIDSKQIKTIVEKSPIADVNYLRRSYKSVEELQAMIFDTEGQIYGEKIQPLSIDTTMLKVGARSQQYTLKNVLFTPNNEGNPAKLVITAGTLEHYTIAEPDVAVWNLSAYVNNSVPATAQYVYAQCSRANNTATFLVTSTQHKFDEGSTYYYFLIGTLSSADAQTNIRSIALQYGFSTINGGFIKTGRIESTDGETYFDLNTGEIAGNIKFTAPEGSDNKQLIDSIINTNSTVSGAVSTAQTANANASSALTTAGQANTKIDNLEVGATNLVSVSQLLQPSYVRRNSDNGYLIEGVSTSSDPRSWNYANAQHHVQLPAGKYFLTLWFENGTSSSTEYRVYTATGSELKTQVVGSNMGKYTFAFTLASETSIGVIVKCYTARYKIKVEQGTIGTEWSASQADITAEIGGIEVGGRNLISLTDTEWSNNADTASWKRYNMPNIPLANGDYMLSFDVKTSNGTDVFYAGLGETDSTRIAVERIKPTTSYTRMSVKIVNSGSYSINSVIVSNAKAYGRGNDNNTGTLYIKNVKLEKGNKATDWTPAPEDTDEYIAENGIEGTCTAQASSETFTYPINAPRFKSSYLKKGLKLKVLMTYANRKQYYASLAINGGTSKAVIWQGSTSNKPIWNADDTVEFIYNGSNWYIADEEQRLLREVYSEAIQGATSVNGGLILTKMIQCGEGNSQAGVSGVRSHDVAFWAGGSPTSANTPVRIFRNGQAFFGRLFLKGTKGNIGFNDDSGNEMWELISDNVPSDYAQHTFSLNDVSGHSTSITGTSVSNDGLWYPVGSLYTISGLSRSRGAKLTFKMSGTVSNNAGALSEVAVGIVAGTATPNPQAEISYLAIKTMAGQSSATFDSTTYTFNFPYSTTDYYYLVLFARSETAGTKINASISVSNLVGTSVNMMTTMGKNGMLIAYNTSNYFTAFIANGIMNIKAHGNFDIGGVLWTGKITSDRRPYPYFKNSGIYGTNEIAIGAGSATNSYIITHRVPNDNYSVSITPEGSNNVNYRIVRGTGSFTVYFSNSVTAFDLTIYGSN